MIPRRISLIGVAMIAALACSARAEATGEISEAEVEVAVAPVSARVILSDLVQTYSGQTLQPTVTTQPAGLPVQLVWASGTDAPVNAGTYRVTAKISDPAYFGEARAMFTISRATPAITWTEPSAITYGTPLSEAQLNATSNVPGTMSYAPAAGTVMSSGAHQLLTAVFMPTDTANFNTVTAVTSVTVNKAIALVSVVGLSQPYDGTPAGVAARTIPANLKVAVEYDETLEEPVFPGPHRVTAIVDDPNYVGSAFEAMNITITALVRHAPKLTGGIDGSLQLLSPEAVTLRGSAWISGDLLVPGTPTLALHGMPMIAGTYDAPGLDSPSNYTVSLEGGSIIRYLVRRIDAQSLPTVPPPLSPTGTRDVVLNLENPTAGDFSSIRNLTLENVAGEVAVPGGTYGVLTANGSGGFVLGHAGATDPDVYYVQRLMLSAGSRLRIAGPVLLVLANGITVSGILGDVRHPEWLTMATAAGDVTIQAESRIYGNILAPDGEITIERAAVVIGEVASDRLTIKADGVLAEPRR